LHQAPLFQPDHWQLRSSETVSWQLRFNQLCRAMTNWDPKVLAARVNVLEEAVRALQSSNTELHNRIDLFLNPAGRFSSKSIYCLCFFYNVKNTEYI
jgi:DNA-binding HxlR family transcriptional regulator